MLPKMYTKLGEKLAEKLAESSNGAKSGDAAPPHQSATPPTRVGGGR